MTDEKVTLRGYDDSAILKEMADGFITRRFASVEDAAKTVLGEDSGSNVDRLRRKFREQNWYQRGLDDYVELEIVRRTSKAQSSSDALDTKPLQRAETRLQRLCSTGVALIKGLTPNGLMAAYGVAIASSLIASLAGQLELKAVVGFALPMSFLGLVLWAAKAGHTATMKVAAVHAGVLAAGFIGLIAWFAEVMPDNNHSVGSLPGACALLIGSLVLGVYFCAFVLNHGGRMQRHGSPEIYGLATAVALLGLLGGVPLLVDIAGIQQRGEAARLAFSKIGEARIKLLEYNPDTSLRVLTEAQLVLAEGLINFPEWATGKKQHAE